MNLEKLKKQLEIDEGRKNYVYSDFDGQPTWPGRIVTHPKTKEKISDPGKPTFGIGHLLKASDPEFYTWKKLAPGGLLYVSENRIDEVFQKDIEICLASCRQIFNPFEDFLDELKQIIANMMFNLGQKRFGGFVGLIIAIDNKDYAMAAKEMQFVDPDNPRKGYSDWYCQVKDRARRLISRMEGLASCQVDKAEKGDIKEIAKVY